MAMIPSVTTGNTEQYRTAAGTASRTSPVECVLSSTLTTVPGVASRNQVTGRGRGGARAMAIESKGGGPGRTPVDADVSGRR